MTRKELIDEVAMWNKLPRKDVERIVENVFKQMCLALKRGDKVQILGFGTFQVKERTKRKVLNPRTGEPMEVPAHKLPTFSAGKALKREVNKRSEANDNRRRANHDRRFFSR